MSSQKMTKAEGLNFIMYLETLIEKIGAGEVDWVAFSAKFSDGGRVAIHSREAPKRPRGVT